VAENTGNSDFSHYWRLWYPALDVAIRADFSWPAAVCFVGSVGWRVLFALGFGPLWATMRYQIRADENGISQTNGFFRQPATWSEVQSYYVAVNPRFHKGRHRYVEPFLLNAHGDIIF
jgi:hypothetical protein